VEANRQFTDFLALMDEERTFCSINLSILSLKNTKVNKVGMGKVQLVMGIKKGRFLLTKVILTLQARRKSSRLLSYTAFLTK